MKEKEINLEEMRQKLLDAAKMLDREVGLQQTSVLYEPQSSLSSLLWCVFFTVQRQDFEEFKGQFLKEQFLDASVFATPCKTSTANKC